MYSSLMDHVDVDGDAFAAPGVTTQGSLSQWNKYAHNQFRDLSPLAADRGLPLASMDERVRRKK
jgi:hypothetical protein